jgi:hypothetical protein
MVLTVSFVLSSVTGFIVTVAPEKLASQERNASIGASGPHDFAVRVSIVRPRHKARRRYCVHRIPRPTFVTMANAGHETGQNKPVIWVR